MTACVNEVTPHSVWAVVPAKSLALSKSRLRGSLGDDARTALSCAMFDDVLAALTSARGLEGVLVVTSDRQIAQRCLVAGVLAIKAPDEGLSAALTIGFRTVAGRGAQRALFIPGDVPMLDPATIERLLANAAAGCIVPAMRDNGTNALLCDARSPVPFEFGPDTARRHQQLAAARGTPLAMRWEAALAVDVDVIDDLRELTARRVGPATAEWLMRHRTSTNVRLTAGSVS